MANSSLPQFAITTGRNMLSVAMGRYRLTEERLLPGHICLMGWFQTLNNAESSLLRVLGTFLRDRKQDQVALFSRFNRNTDGEIDLAEREEARKRSEQEVLREHAACAWEPVTPTLAKLDSNRRPFIISATPQASLIRRCWRFSFTGFATMSVIAAGLLWAIAARLR